MPFSTLTLCLTPPKHQYLDWRYQTRCKRGRYWKRSILIFPRRRQARTVAANVSGRGCTGWGGRYGESIRVVGMTLRARFGLGLGVGPRLKQSWWVSGLGVGGNDKGEMLLSSDELEEECDWLLEKELREDRGVSESMLARGRLGVSGTGDEMGWVSWAGTCSSSSKISNSSEGTAIQRGGRLSIGGGGDYKTGLGYAERTNADVRRRVGRGSSPKSSSSDAPGVAGISNLLSSVEDAREWVNVVHE
ncbi:hypothetical protein EV702DRAFT_1214118 [Suillus placidus]|uniref:Uncharacterized protein n=1 Tax=Suillus placidus TaxID=48579 RepID=A0A9P7D504_9AGAM|nr:hypothetical protein EV702DRAFT_1214118 [Suillus placidus]